MSTTAPLLALLLLLFQIIPPVDDIPRRMPDGRSRDLAVLQRDYEQSKKDVAEMVRLAEELQDEIEKNREFVIDVRSVEKTEQIEKLAKQIRRRLKRMQ